MLVIMENYKMPSICKGALFSTPSSLFTGLRIFT